MIPAITVKQITIFLEEVITFLARFSLRQLNMSCHRNLKLSIINMNFIWLFSVLLRTTPRKKKNQKNQGKNVTYWIFCFTFILLENVHSPPPPSIISSKGSYRTWQIVHTGKSCVYFCVCRGGGQFRMAISSKAKLLTVRGTELLFAG